jgi:hypothetical protein
LVYIELGGQSLEANFAVDNLMQNNFVQSTLSSSLLLANFRSALFCHKFFNPNYANYDTFTFRKQTVA